MALGSGLFPLEDAWASDPRMAPLAPLLNTEVRSYQGVELPVIPFTWDALCGQMLRISVAARQACIGLDGVNDADVKAKVTVALLTVDGAERFYRNLFTKMDRHASTIFLIDTGMTAPELGPIVHREGAQVKFCMLTHRDAVQKLLFAMAAKQSR